MTGNPNSPSPNSPTTTPPTQLRESPHFFAKQGIPSTINNLSLDWTSQHTKLTKIAVEPQKRYTNTFERDQGTANRSIPKVLPTRTEWDTPIGPEGTLVLRSTVEISSQKTSKKLDLRSRTFQGFSKKVFGDPQRFSLYKTPRRNTTIEYFPERKSYHPHPQSSAKEKSTTKLANNTSAPDDIAQYSYTSYDGRDMVRRRHLGTASNIFKHSTELLNTSRNYSPTNLEMHPNRRNTNTRTFEA
ncbi:hypothetical protein Hypma_016208 [Hypsizygus marmoreus]|uniref:Uncharacterized protein n=1 Tax=Hypsizygus marmoreus TaxID=39966 RepID=A0A369J782_HYPMA|nr:hypothetical protein Hypma_016208 [Hypsizygus marmoreus]